VNPENKDFHLTLGFETKFTRALPKEAKEATLKQFKTLDLNQLHDCRTAKEIKLLS